eukprot:7605128-Pyramimonas_sp.AAC.1
MTSESAGAPAVSASPSAGMWKFSTHSISAGCPAMGVPSHSARSISPRPANTSSNSSPAQFSRAMLALRYLAAMTLTTAAELSAGSAKRDSQST